jgi:hypothetical protein
MWHETELLPHRPDGFPVAADRAVGSGAEIGRTACEVRASRDHQRDPVHHAQRLYVAQCATRFSPVSDRVLLLPPVATGWHLGADSRQAPRASAPPRGQATKAVGRGARQPECQNDRTRRATWLRRGEKKSPAANGTWSSTRSDCCGHWSLRPLAYKTAMAADWPSKPSAARSSSPKSSGRTKHIARWSSGPKRSGVGSSKSSLDHPTLSRFNPSDGSSNVPSAGSTAPVAWPSPTNAPSKAIKPSSSLP